MKIFLVGLLLLSRSALGYTVQLGWSPVPGAAGYKLYCRSQGMPYGVGIDLGALAPGTDGIVHGYFNGLASDTTYYFVVTDYNPSRIESAFSNEVSSMVPARPRAPILLGFDKAVSTVVESPYVHMEVGYHVQEAPLQIPAPLLSAQFHDWHFHREDQHGSAHLLPLPSDVDTSSGSEEDPDSSVRTAEVA